MGVEREYLFYGIRSKQHQEAEEAPSQAKGKVDGLCWLTIPVSSSPESADRSIDLSVPKFFTAPPSHQILNVVRDNVVPFLQRPDSTEGERWMVIWNDQAGQKQAKQWLDDIILPLLDFAGISSSQIQIYHSRQLGWEQDLRFNRCIILGGDGTVSDFLNQLHSSLHTITDGDGRNDGDKSNTIKFDLIIIPLGTANAMFHATHPDLKDLTRPKSILSGLMTALLEPTRRADGVPEPVPPTLTLSRVRTVDKAGTTVEKLVSFVVASTSLHASILNTANQLRFHPEYQSSGIQIFKQAFLENASRTWNASVKLFPSKSNGTIERYEPSEDKLISVPVDQTDGDGAITLDGQFSYFTSCLVDRLESKFVIAPLRKTPYDSLAQLNSTIDLVVVRPMRDSNMAHLDQSTPDYKDSLTKLISSVMQAAYQEGHHIKLLTSNEQIPVVEYYRCGGWIWTPTDDENIDHQVCIDGKIVNIPQGGSVECTILPEEETRIRAY